MLFVLAGLRHLNAMAYIPADSAILYNRIGSVTRLAWERFTAVADVVE